MASSLTEDEKYMKQALRLAKKAMDSGDVPIGCLIVYDGKVIARGYNRRKAVSCACRADCNQKGFKGYRRLETGRM